MPKTKSEASHSGNPAALFQRIIRAHQDQRRHEASCLPACWQVLRGKVVFARPARGKMLYMPDWLTGPLKESQMFNLHVDPAESKNLAADHLDILKQLTDLAEQSRATLGDYTDPGKKARFFDVTPSWPAATP